MINHARNLLLNVDGAIKPSPAIPGEEYIPPGFKTLTPLPTYLQRLRTVLFGPDPDRVFMNYRVSQFAGVLHGTELTDWVTALDRRMTYWPAHNGLFTSYLLPANVTTVSGSGSPTLTILGDVDGFRSDRRLLWDWRVTVIDGNNVRVDNLDRVGATTILPYTYGGGISTPINLPGTNLDFNFHGDAAATWLIRILARPVDDLGVVTERLASLVQGEVDQELFGKTVVDPYDTFRSIWLGADELPYRLGGLLLAIIYRMDELFRTKTQDQ